MWQDMSSSERLKTVSKLTEAGLTARTIGEQLGTTKGAVLGIMHRAKPTVQLAEKKRLAAVREQSQQKADAVREERRLKREAEWAARKQARDQPPWAPLPGTTPRPLHTLKLAGECCWPLWERDGEPKLYCGEATRDGVLGPYCKAHIMVAYTPVRPKQKAVSHA